MQGLGNMLWNIRGDLNWKNPKNFSFWPKFSGPPPPLFVKGPYRRKRRYFVPNSNYKVQFFQSFKPLPPYFIRKPNLTDFINWGGPLVADRYHRKSFKACLLLSCFEQFIHSLLLFSWYWVFNFWWFMEIWDHVVWLHQVWMIGQLVVRSM